MKEGRECTPVRTFDRRQTIDCVRGRRQYFMSLATIPVVIVINIYRRRCGVAVVTVKSHVYYFTSISLPTLYVFVSPKFTIQIFQHASIFPQ